MAEMRVRGFWKFSNRKEILKKDLEVSKKVFIFAPLSAEKTAVSQGAKGAKRSDRNPGKTKKMFI